MGDLFAPLPLPSGKKPVNKAPAKSSDLFRFCNHGAVVAERAPLWRRGLAQAADGSRRGEAQHVHVPGLRQAQEGPRVHGAAPDGGARGGARRGVCGAEQALPTRRERRIVVDRQRVRAVRVACSYKEKVGFKRGIRAPCERGTRARVPNGRSARAIVEHHVQQLHLSWSRSSATAMPANYRPLYTRPTFVDESLFGTPNETAVKMSRSMPASVRNGVTVMGAQELSNIGFRAKSKGGETGLAHQRRLERDRLQKLSDERKAKWPNTIEAARAAKEKQRKAKLDAEEALRQQIDAEEEALNVEKRRLAIERANKMLYHGTDRVKELHSKLLLADVMQERECQIELKKKLKQRQLVQDELWYQKQQDAIRRMDAEEDLRDREEEEKRVLVAKVREEQVQQQRNMHASRVAMTKREGEIMRNAAAEELKVEARQREEAKEEEQRLRAEVRPRRRPPPPTPSPSRRNPPHPRPPARLPTPACPPPRSPPPLPLAPHRASLPPSPTPPNLRLSLPALFLGRDIHPPRAAARSLSLLRLRAPPRSLWRQTTRSWQSARRCSDSPTSRRLRCSSTRRGRRRTCSRAATARRSDSARARRGGSRLLISRWRL